MCVAGSSVCSSPQIGEIIQEGCKIGEIALENDYILTTEDSLVADRATLYTDDSQTTITLLTNSKLKVRI